MTSSHRLYHNMKLFDGHVEALQDRRIVITNGEVIEGIADINEIDHYRDCEKIDLAGNTMLPGFIDAHIHITVPFIMKVTPMGLLQMNRQVEKNLENCLKYGVTTIRDVASFPRKMLKWRRRIDSNPAIRPRIVTSLSFITCPKGVPEMVPTLNFIEACITGGQFAERVSTPGEVTKVANRLLDMGADFLNTQYTANSFLFHGKIPNLSDDCFDALVQVGRKRGVKVAMHHLEREGFIKGVAAGVNTLEHCATDQLEDAEIERFVSGPPEDTRAWCRALLLRLAGRERIDHVDWDAIRFKQTDARGWTTYRTLTMPNPLRMTKAEAACAFQRGHTLDEVLDQLIDLQAAAEHTSPRRPPSPWTARGE